MTRRLSPIWLAAMLIVGCLPSENRTTTVPNNPFGTSDPARFTPKQAVRVPASEEAAKRVLEVGGKVVAANRQTGLRPAFNTIGTAEPEIFHRGTSEVWITEGLVRQCKTEGQLAAVLSRELGKMVSEREALASAAIRVPDRGPPVSVPVGNDSRGAFGAADGVRLAELAKYDKSRHRPDDPLPPPPDPDVLGRTYLTNAGFATSDLDEAAPLLKAAEGNAAFQKQMSTVPVRPNVRE